MLWKKGRRSDNVEDVRDQSTGGGGGMRIGGGKGLSLMAVVMIVGIGLLTGQDPMQILGQLSGQLTDQSSPQVTQPAGRAPAANDEQADFVRAILGDTEDTWRQVFQQAGRSYKDPTLVLFRGQINSACGFATAASGPFYCPADQKVYLDMSFFQEMAQRFKAAGDFAQAYVIAHEVGHHVQTLLGVSSKMQMARQQGKRMEGDGGLLVRQELQAKLGDKVKDLSGVKIFTTFDSVAQDAAEKAAVEGIPALKKQRKLSDLETAIVVVDRFSGEVRAMVGGSEPQFAGYNRAMQARRSIGSLAKPATYLTALSQPKIYRLNTWIADAPIALRQPNGQVWSPQNDDRRYSESGRVMLVDALTRSMNVPTVNLGMALGLPAVTETWIKLGVPKDQLHPVPAMLLGALNLTPIEVAQAFQTIASGGNRAPLSALRSVIAEDGKVLYQSFPQAERAVPAQAAYLTLWTMQQVVQRGTGRQLGAKYPNLHLAGKTGTTNNNVDTWFAGIDGSTVTITWVGRDNNQPTKLYGASGAMSIYQRYLANQTPTPLNLVPPEDIADMGVDYDGNFVCSGGMRVLPVWTSDPQSLCQQSEIQQQPSGNPFDQSSQPQQQPQQQPAQQEQKDSDGVAGWIKDMFGSN